MALVHLTVCVIVYLCEHSFLAVHYKGNFVHVAEAMLTPLILLLPNSAKVLVDSLFLKSWCECVTVVCVGDGIVGRCLYKVLY